MNNPNPSVPDRDPLLHQTSGKSSDSGEISLSELLAVLHRRRRILALTAVIIIGLGTAFCLFKTKRYEATTDLAINPEGSNALDLGDVTSALGGGGLGFDEKLETQVRVLQSKQLAWTVISQLRLDREPTFTGTKKYFLFGPRVLDESPDDIEKTSPEKRNRLLKTFSKSLNVQTIPRTQAVTIAYRDASPELARKVVEHMAQAYIRWTFMTRYEDTMKTSDWLSGQLVQIRKDVEDSEAKLSQLQAKTGIFGTDENNNLVLTRLDDLNKELTDAEASRIEKEAKYRVALTGNPELIGNIVPGSVLNVLRNQEADTKLQLAQATSEFGAKYPAVVRLTDQLAAVERSIKAEIQSIQERFRSDLEVAQATERQTRVAFDEQKHLATDLAGGFDQFGVLKRAVDSGHELYDDLQKKIKEAGVVASLKASTVDVIDPAVLPTKAKEPNTPLIMVLSVLVGLGLGLALAFVAESLDTVIRTSATVEEMGLAPLFGVIPHISSSRSRQRKQVSRSDAKSVPDAPSPPVSYHEPSRTAEAFRTLRTALLLSSPGAPPKTILITSAVPREGKTTVIINTAIAFAQKAQRVLLIDADLRLGTIQARLGLTPNSGLSGALTSSDNWRDLVQPMPDHPNLDVLQAGPRPPNSADLVGSEQMHALLQEAATIYDHVFLDTPPVLLVTDPVLLAQQCHTVLLVSRIGVTQRGSLLRSAKLLRTGTTGLSGLVINDLSAADSYYGYGYGYGYGYDYAGGGSYFTDESDSEDKS